MAKSQATSGFIYVWRDRKHNRYYIGSHWGTENDGYICSSTWMRNAYRRRPEDFKRRIIAWVNTSRVDLLVEEERWLQMIQPHEIKHRYYNIRRDTQHLWHSVDDGVKLSIGQKISAAKMGKSPNWKDPTERGRRISEGKKKALEARLLETGSKFTEEHRQRMSAAKKGSTQTNEWKAANSERMKAQWADGTRKGKPRDPSKKKPRKVVLCKVCGVDTLNPRKNFCSKEHRYQAMNATRASKEGSKWCRG